MHLSLTKHSIDFVVIDSVSISSLLVSSEAYFFRCKIEPGIWIRNCGDYSKHIAAHIENLLIASEDP